LQISALTLMSRPNLGNLSIAAIYRPTRPLASASTLTNQEIPRKRFLRRHALRWGILQLPLAPALSPRRRGEGELTAAAEQRPECGQGIAALSLSPFYGERDRVRGRLNEPASLFGGYGSNSGKLRMMRSGRIGESGGSPIPYPSYQMA